MTDDEIDFVAAELAKAGGISWYPGRERGPLKLITERYRDRARLAIAAIDRYRAGQSGTAGQHSLEGEQPEPGTTVASSPSYSPKIGSMVLYRPAGDRRAYLCRVEKIEGSRAYLVPELKTCSGWIEIRHLSPAAAGEASGLQHPDPG
jgi:hypothetical protein